MASFKSLAGDTLIYGGGTIFVRLLNWLLMPYYIRSMDSLQYGYITEVYSYIAIFLVVLTYGFETTFFRFAKKDNYKHVFTTGLTSIVSTSLLFILVIFIAFGVFNSNGDTSFFNELLIVGALVVSIDAITSLVFAKLRYQSRSVRFALLKLLNVLVLISFNIFFLLICPFIRDYDFLNSSHYFLCFDWFYKDNYEAFYVLFSNFCASLVILMLLLKEIKGSLVQFDYQLLKKMFGYSFPILIVGITGMINQSIDKSLLPRLIGGDEGRVMVAIYGANFKIGVLMAMFTQSFRMAFEPFFFKHKTQTDSTGIYSSILTYFVLFGLLIFIGVTFFLDIVNLLLTPEYQEGNVVIPIILVAQLLSGIYFTLSIWYKVSDKTIYGAYMGVIGMLVTLIANIFLIPLFGYVGSAIAGLLCYGTMLFFSILWGNKYYPIHYHWRKIGLYILFVSIIYIVGLQLIPFIINELLCIQGIWNSVLNYLIRIGLIIVFLGFVYKNEFQNIIINLNDSKS